MTTNLQQHYKDREPNETIQIIKNFFINRGYTIEATNIIQSESMTWSCCINLYLDDEYITSSYGKGTQKEYALASGYAELYERFCNRLEVYVDYFLSSRVYEKNKQLNGYGFAPNEKTIDLKLGHPSEAVNQMLKQRYEDDINIQYFYNLCGKYANVAIPYTNIGDAKKHKYIAPIPYLKLLGSSGMAAGNTLPEALVQGISEVLEHIAQENFYKDKSVELYKQLDPLQFNINITAIINAITSSGCKIRLYDMSYATGIPAILAVLYCPGIGNIHIDIGVAPVIDIAVERSLTELYQNVNSYTLPQLNSFNQPFKQYEWDEAYAMACSHLPSALVIPESILWQINEYQSYNTDIFLPSNDYSNDDLLQYYQALLKKNQIQAYYYDNSLDPQMSAVHIIITQPFHYRHSIMPLQDSNAQILLKLLLTYYRALDRIYSTQNVTIGSMYVTKLLKQLIQFTTTGDTIRSTEACNALAPYISPRFFDLEFAMDCVNIHDPSAIINKYSNSYFMKYARKYLWLYLYNAAAKYNKEQITTLGQTLFPDLTKNDIECVVASDYLIKHIFLIPLVTEWNSLRYDKFIKSYCNL